VLVWAFTYGRKWFFRYDLNISPLDQPVSDIEYWAPALAPFINSGFSRLPLKTKYGGSACPMALQHPISVVVVERGDFTDCGLLLGVAITFGGQCSGCRLVSSKL